MRLRRRWTHWVLEAVDLLDHAEERIAKLSGGMRRRLALAQALLGEPEYLVLDEPLTSLDPEHRTRVATLLSTMAAFLP